jgi:hypothetical protein
MTKNVRVENGDSNTSYKIVVEKWNKGDPNSDPLFLTPWRSTKFSATRLTSISTDCTAATT